MVAQRDDALPASTSIPYGHRFRVLAAPLPTQCPAYDLGRQRTMAQVLGALCSCERPGGALAVRFGLAQLRPLQPFGE